MTAWHPELAIIAPGCAHVYLVPDNGSISHLQTVQWTANSPESITRREDTASALIRLFRAVGVDPGEDVADISNRLWAQLDRRPAPKPA